MNFALEFIFVMVNLAAIFSLDEELKLQIYLERKRMLELELTAQKDFLTYFEKNIS